MSEKISEQNIIDQNSIYETERKFVPVDPADLSSFMSHESTVAIEQVYLSTPDEPYSLRLRSTANATGISYEATLKDRGIVRPDGIHRLEVTAPLSRELYHYYTDGVAPRVRKLRAEPVPEVTIDFYEDGTSQIESEDEARWSQFVGSYGIAVREVTSHGESDNEQRAYRGIHLKEPADIQVDEMIQEIVEKKAKQVAPIFVHIGGRSGSGKSTIVQELTNELAEIGLSSEVMSTDDYHRGQTWLTAHNNGDPWEHWDDPIVYDTAAMATDLHQLVKGHSVRRRTIDWHAVEPRFNSLLEPADVIIIEGIYALAPEITSSEGVIRELQTPLATCVGRRLLRDITERPQFADPAKSLSYMLSEVEPAYRIQLESRVTQ